MILDMHHRKILTALDDADGPLSVPEIANRTSGLDTATIGRRIRFLERHGYVDADRDGRQNVYERAANEPDARTTWGDG